MFRQLDRLLEKLEKGFLVLLFSALIVLMSLNIVQRNIFGQSSQHILEFLPTLVMWISLIGASLALRQGKHIRMELLVRFLPPRVQHFLHRCVGLFGALVMLLGLYLSLDFMAGEMKIFGARGYLSSIIPGFFAVASFRYLLMIFYPSLETETETH